MCVFKCTPSPLGRVASCLQIKNLTLEMDIKTVRRFLPKRLENHRKGLLCFNLRPYLGNIFLLRLQMCLLLNDDFYNILKLTVIIF